MRGGAQRRLRIRPVGCTRGGVARVADSVIAGHGAERCLVKDLGDQPHILIHVNAFAVAGCYTG